MCGIAGIYSFKGNISPEGIKKVTDLLRHRGPDDEGFLAVNSGSGEVFPLIGNDSKVQGQRIEDFNKPVDLFLGHRRLAIIDLSSAGHQPMCNEDGSLWIIHNGEIYNYLDIGKELERLGHCLKSQTDTEVVLHAYEEWGTGCLTRFNGMWAFALVDLRKKLFFCSRDRAGVKPFYYVYGDGRFCFASEIKALLELEGFTAEPNDQIIADYLFSGILDHTNETFFKNIFQLRQGEYLLFEDKKLTIRSYWDIDPKEVRFVRDGDYAERFYELLEDSIRLRLRSDVPIGSCLSGGLDSSSIVCLANKLMFDGESIDRKLIGEKQKTFSSSFEVSAYDERKFIELVIGSTGAERNYVFPKAENLHKDLPRLLWYQEEPFGSTSIYAQWSVMKLAKERGVTVLLDGQGADELLAGYTPAFYHLFAQLLKTGRILQLAKEIMAFRNRHTINTSQFLKGILAVLLSPSEKVRIQRTGWADKRFLHQCLRPVVSLDKFEDVLNNYLYRAFRFVALPGLLHYEDRNSMAFSLEARLPFLDFRLVEYLFSLPSEQKIREGVSKVVLRAAMKDILPEEIKNRMDKMGFATPEDIWFRTVLRNTISEIINSKSFDERGYFDVYKVRKAFDKHCEGKINISPIIWRWVNIELWLRTFIDRRSSTQS
jgi:asparagine synthase (glutamine-hydrolysing)